MKAKQYAEQYLGAENKHKELSNILHQFHEEIGELRKLKRITQSSAMTGVVRELNDKYKSFAYTVNSKAKKGEGLSNSEFIVMLKEHEPDLYKNYNQNKDNGLRNTNAQTPVNDRTREAEKIDQNGSRDKHQPKKFGQSQPYGGSKTKNSRFRNRTQNSKK